MIASLCHVCHDSDKMPARKSLCSYCTYCHILLHIPLRQLFFKVCVCVCVCFHFFCFGNGKCHAIFWLAPSVTFFSLLLQHLGWILRSFSSHNQFVLSIFRSSTSFMSTIADCKVFLIARFHNHFLVSITMSFFLSQMFAFFFFLVWLIKPYIWVALSVWWLCMILISSFSLPQYIDFCPASVETTGQNPEAKKKLSCLAWVLILVICPHPCALPYT
jgi:hypothetical protein